MTLSGTASDVDPGDTLTYLWTHDSALTIAITGSDSLSASFTAPDVAANTTITVTLTVSDGTVEVSDALQVTITDSPSLPPAADAGLNLTAAGSITDAGTLKLLGARGITTFESGGSTYAAVTSAVDDGVQILDITDPSDITTAGSINDTATLLLYSARGITTFESGGSAYAAVAAYEDDGIQILRLTGGAPTATLDNPPAATSIERSSPAAASTGSQTLVYKVTFSEDVTGVDAGDFALSSGGTGTGSVTNLAGSGSQYLVNVSAAQDGTYNLDLVPSGHDIADAADNPLSSPAPTGADRTHTVSTASADTTAPTVTSIVRSDPTDETTSAQTLVFAVTFSEDVTGVDLSDFALSPDSTGGGSAHGRFAQTSEPAIPITDHSTIQDAITVDRSGTAASVSVAVDITHTYIGDLVIDLIAPDGTAQTLHSRPDSSADDINQTYTLDFGSVSITGDWILRVSDEAGGDTGTLNGWTLTIDHGGADSPVTGLAGSDSQYLVNVSAAQDGTYNLDIVPNNGITDMAGNPLGGTGPTGEDQSYTVRPSAIQNATTNTPPSINAGPDQTVQGAR